MYKNIAKAHNTEIGKDITLERKRTFIKGQDQDKTYIKGKEGWRQSVISFKVLDLPTLTYWV